MGTTRVPAVCMAVFCTAALSTTLLCATAPALAAWSHDSDENTLICGEEGNQIDPAIAPDGEGGAFIAWADFRDDGVADAYVQHVDSHGRLLWGAGGVQVCAADSSQLSVDVDADGEGGAVVVWQEKRMGAACWVFAQRIDAGGSQVWSPDGVRVCDDFHGQYDPMVVSDGSGGAYVVWEDVRNAQGFTFYWQQLDASGTPLWSSGGLEVGPWDSAHAEPSVAPDSRHGALVAWKNTGASGDSDIRATLLLPGHSWASNGVIVADLSTEGYGPDIVSDGSGGAVVAWLDLRSGMSSDVYAQRVDSDGNEVWATNGVVVCDDAAWQSDMRLTTDGEHGAIVTWSDGRNGGDVYAQRVSAAGTALWTDDGVVVCGADDGQVVQQIVSDGAGGAVIAWIDFRPGGEGIYAQRVDAAGNPLWMADGVALTTAPGIQSYRVVASDGEGGAVVTWRDSRGTDYDIYAQRIERNGYLGYPSGDIDYVRDVPGDQGGQVYLAWNASYLDPWPEMQIENYTLWRAIGPARAGARTPEWLPAEAVVLTGAAELADVGLEEDEQPEAGPPEPPGPVFLLEERARGTFYWELVQTVPAYHLESYGATVPTLFDSTATTDEYHYFQTIAHTSDPTVFWVSLPDSGRSVDNLAPGAPLALLAGVVEVDVELTWSPSGHLDEDLSHYDVHRNEAPGFTPDEATLVATATDTVFLDLDPGPITWYYRVVAEDVHGNEGDASNEALATLGTGVGSPELPSVLTLRGSFPNPLGPGTEIVFALPAPAHVTVDVYSVDGRRVATLADGEMDAGPCTVSWDGTDAGGAAVPAGVYLYRVEAGAERVGGKMVVVR